MHVANVLGEASAAPLTGMLLARASYLLPFYLSAMATPFVAVLNQAFFGAFQRVPKGDATLRCRRYRIEGHAGLRRYERDADLSTCFTCVRRACPVQPVPAAVGRLLDGVRRGSLELDLQLISA
jgi:hypothetical protein